MTALLQHPIWKSSWFIFGLIGIGFGVGSFVQHSETAVPVLEELRVVKGKFNKLEDWAGRRGGTAYILDLTVNGESKQFNVNRCQEFLRFDEARTLEKQLKPGDRVVLYADESGVLVDGAVWKIVKNGIDVCTYDEVVAYQERSDEVGFRVFAPFMLITGFLMVVLGLYRTGCRKI